MVLLQLTKEEFKKKLLALSSGKTDAVSCQLSSLLVNVADLEKTEILYHRSCCKSYQLRHTKKCERSRRSSGAAVISASDQISSDQAFLTDAWYTEELDGDAEERWQSILQDLRSSC